MKTIKVVAAIIRKDKSVFATQRGYGDYKDWWEFPGGKVEPGETPEEALVREIREELTLLEHEAASWLRLGDLRQINWLPADVKVVEAIEADKG